MRKDYNATDYRTRVEHHNCYFDPSGSLHIRVQLPTGVADLEIDIWSLARRLGGKAIKNRSGKSGIGGGLVKARRSK